MILFNQKSDTGTFPLEWKQVNVIPVFKSGDHHLLANYRPIPVISTIAKMFEVFVHQQVVVAYFTSKNLLGPAQSCFCVGHNTWDLLLKVVDDWKQHNSPIRISIIKNPMLLMI